MDLKQLLKTTPKFISILNANWINNMQDLFMYFPRIHEDRSNIKTLNQILIDDTIQSVKWKIISKTLVRTRTWKRLAEIIFEDIHWNKWFINLINANFMFASIKQNSWYVIIGKPQFEHWKIFFWHPELVLTAAEENSSDEAFKIWRIYPVYPELMWISSAWFAKKIWDNLHLIKDYFQETLPNWLLKEYDLLDINSAIKNIHYPENFDIIKQAKYRLIFERLLRVQLISIINKNKYQGSIWKSTPPDRDIVKEFVDSLPFQLTNAQKKAIKNIIDDIHSWKPMLRLLQWDVWSWKTIVATASAYYIIKKLGWQVALLAPTEVLATQHAIGLSKLLLPLGINMNTLTWSTTAKDKEKIKQDLAWGKINLIIWTHAILQEDVNFKDLKYAVIDEQHKFGVMQRSFFKKFNSPHILQMTATPIPRSLTLAFFGEFDVSIIDEMPVWRQEIFTKIITEQELIKMKPWVMTKISQWQNIYIVTALIEDSEKLEDTKSATQQFQDITQQYPELKGEIWLLHWKLKPKEKEQIMKDFKSWKLKILISTTVIEVWIDVPNATVMIIKNAERFGLSQLHQLRWRVWRSELKSYCFLQTKSKSWDSYKRLKAMEQLSDWFKLAQLDLEIRWSWEILWTRQSGEADIPPEIITNIKFLENIQQAAFKLLEKSPNLEEYTLLKQQLLTKESDLFI